MSTVRTDPPRPAVPNSNVRVQVARTFQDARWSGQGPSVQVRCGACERRLFDVTGGLYFHGDYGMVDDGTLVLERVCPGCRLKNRGTVTATPGEPTADGLSGPWRCGCGKSLARVDPIRTRVHVTCRCGTEARVRASDALATASDPPAPPIDKAAFLEAALFDAAALDDVPF